MSKPMGRGGGAGGPKTAQMSGIQRPGAPQKVPPVPQGNGPLPQRGPQRAPPVQKNQLPVQQTGLQGQQAHKGPVQNGAQQQQQHQAAAAVAAAAASADKHPQTQAKQQQQRQQPQQQQQQTQQRKHPLEQLHTMLNFLLVFTGRILGNPTRLTPETIGSSNHQLRQTTPQVLARTHDALDELESELHIAQLVLRRDLAASKKEKAMRRAAAEEQERARKAAEEAERAEAERKAAAEKEKKTETIKENSTATATKDIEMSDVPPRPPPPRPAPVDTTSAIATSSSKSSAVVGGASATKTPTTANTFDFDSMFDDMGSAHGDGHHEGPDGGAAMDIDFGFGENKSSSGSTTNDNHTSNDPPPPAAMSQAPTEEPQTSLGLLPGLESYAKNHTTNMPLVPGFHNSPTSNPGDISKLITTRAPDATKTTLSTGSIEIEAGLDIADGLDNGGDGTSGGGGFGEGEGDDDRFLGGGGSTFDEMFNYEGIGGNDWSGSGEADPFADL